MMLDLLFWLDPYLIWFYRRTGWAELDYFLGTAVLATGAWLLGKLSAQVVVALSRRYAVGWSAKAKKYHDLSLQALQTGDRAAYEAANKLANEAFNKSFYLGVAQSAAYFWPCGLALAWMQTRFLEITLPLPLLGWPLSYVAVFILLYLLVWLTVGSLRKGCARWRRRQKDNHNLSTLTLVVGQDSD